MRKLIGAAAALLIAGCGGEPAEQKEQTAQALQPGEYEVTMKVESVQSTDQTTPATTLQPGAALEPVRACVAADGAIAEAAFAEPGDECRTQNSYARNGRITAELLCTREGTPGEIMQTVSGTFKQDSFDADVTTTTYLPGRGDYSANRTVTGRRVGECPPPGAAAEGNNAQ